MHKLLQQFLKLFQGNLFHTIYQKNLHKVLQYLTVQLYMLVQNNNHRLDLIKLNRKIFYLFKL